MTLLLLLLSFLIILKTDALKKTVLVLCYLYLLLLGGPFLNFDFFYSCGSDLVNLAAREQNGIEVINYNCWQQCISLEN